LHDIDLTALFVNALVIETGVGMHAADANLSVIPPAIDTEFAVGSTDPSDRIDHHGERLSPVTLGSAYDRGAPREAEHISASGPGRHFRPVYCRSSALSASRDVMLSDACPIHF
jgi:hypothetical protein